MADVKISALPAAVSVADADLLVIVQGGTTKQAARSLAVAGLVTTTRTVAGHALSSDVTVSKSDVGLGSVDNTSDAGKPVSTAQQTALDLKANLASPTFTGTVVLPSGQALVAPVLGTPASGTLTNCTFPTLNQNTTGSAAKLTTARTIAGVSFDGTANISIPFSGISSPPTSAAGYGITNGAAIDTWGGKTAPSGTVLGTTDSQTVSGKSIAATQLTGGFPNVVMALKSADALTVTGGYTSFTAYPIYICVKSVTVLTAGTPADLVTITLPAGLTRWRCVGTGAGNGFSTMFIETAAGTLAAGTMAAFDNTGGAGNQVMQTTAPGTTVGTGAVFLSSTTLFYSTTSTLCIRQMANSANAGTVSFYIMLAPLSI